jgi:hypothetical protein
MDFQVELKFKLFISKLLKNIKKLKVHINKKWSTHVPFDPTNDTYVTVKT